MQALPGPADRTSPTLAAVALAAKSCTNGSCLTANAGIACCGLCAAMLLCWNNGRPRDRSHLLAHHRHKMPAPPSSPAGASSLWWRVAHLTSIAVSGATMKWAGDPPCTVCPLQGPALVSCQKSIAAHRCALRRQASVAFLQRRASHGDVQAAEVLHYCSSGEQRRPKVHGLVLPTTLVIGSGGGWSASRG